jgi:hypothetical protein
VWPRSAFPLANLSSLVSWSGFSHFQNEIRLFFKHMRLLRSFLKLYLSAYILSAW